METIEALCSARVLNVLLNKVHQHLGQDFSGGRTSDLLRRLKLLALERGEGDLQLWLETLAFAEWDDALVQSLTPVFSVGETYFRRDSEALDWVARQHLAPLIARRREDGRRRLRIWSAACCTGEEAYSLLFILDDLLGAERASWTVELLASDLNASFLQRAEHGSYGQNAFRRNEDDFRRCYFQAEGRQWRVRPQWRGRIRFFQHNLVQGQLPDAAKGLAEADLILCRNVLMYFSPEQASGALRRLLASLAADGLLLLSAVEAGIATQAGLNGFWAGSNYALVPGSRRPALRTAVAPPPVAPVEPATRRTPPPAPRLVEKKAAAPSPAPPPVASASDSNWQQARDALAHGRYPQAQQALLDYLACAGLGQAQKRDACLLMARSWANQQRADEAETWLQRALALDPASAAAYWLTAMLAQQTGAEQAALVALQKALYLEPDFILAHFYQARLLRLRGQLAASDKALRNCMQLLGRRAPDDLVSEGDGLSCAQLLRLCEQLKEGRR
ncbi:CheR family methyltransferase [Pseudomonas sp. LFM046]|uniref:CheR family methyltransferase n=1 Tax=Pseudomonas sp. LFM046 TaxID=1608357 RepID=UPI000695DA61|nr:CheR family methyltransferase [Pseudomonas sp. LFM046]